MLTAALELCRLVVVRIALHEREVVSKVCSIFGSKALVRPRFSTQRGMENESSREDDRTQERGRKLSWAPPSASLVVCWEISLQRFLFSERSARISNASHLLSAFSLLLSDFLNFLARFRKKSETTTITGQFTHYRNFFFSRHSIDDCAQICRLGFLSYI